ncbi:MAG: hydroxyphenylacetyl-CoA thioesterase PaaI [Taibaiella sp.]|nr:hydroxyphenylacetyl-CoA thioesterase PaaI [Taibaiella sp.]
MAQHQELTPSQVLEIMLAKDKFSSWLGLKVIDIAAGYCKLHFTVVYEMLNGFGYVHGGILFSAADSAFEFACNTHGYATVALDVSVSFTRPVRLGEVLTVEAKEEHRGEKTGIYDVRTTNEKGELVSMFKGMAYVTSKQIAL